jgi:hypothetical protein
MLIAGSVEKIPTEIMCDAGAQLVNGGFFRYLGVVIRVGHSQAGILAPNSKCADRFA